MKHLGALLERKRLYLIGVCWGAAGMALSGLIGGTLREGMFRFGFNKAQDTAYHFHVSTVLAVAAALLIYGFTALWRINAAGGQKLSRLFRRLLACDGLALAGGAAAALLLGWCKEVFDASQGRFADPGDLYADVTGVANFLFPAAALLLPVHLLAWLLAEPLRHGFLVAFCPAEKREQLKSAFRIETRIHAQSAELDGARVRAAELDDEIRRLEDKLETATAAGIGAEKQAKLAGDLTRKRGQLETLTDRIAELEAENLRLRHELEGMLRQLPRTPGAELLRRELSGIIQASSRNLAAAAAARQTAETALQRSSPAPSPASAPVAPAKETTAELEELRAAYELRGRQLRQTEDEAARLGAELKTARALLAEAEARPQGEWERLAEQLRRRVLVVDDEKGIREVIRVVLEDTGMIKVDTADGVISALELLKSGKPLPDLIILDIKMPKFSGTEFSASLQRSNRLSSIPIVFCSGLSEESVLRDIKDLRHVDYIRKPFKAERVKSAVFTALGLEG